MNKRTLESSITDIHDKCRQQMQIIVSTADNIATSLTDNVPVELDREISKNYIRINKAIAKLDGLMSSLEEENKKVYEQAKKIVGEYQVVLTKREHDIAANRTIYALLELLKPKTAGIS